MNRLLGGYPLPECPISTIDGVKAADVGWYSESRFALVRGQDAFERAPEVCVEVISPSNTNSEMRQERAIERARQLGSSCEVLIVRVEVL